MRKGGGGGRGGGQGGRTIKKGACSLEVRRPGIPPGVEHWRFNNKNRPIQPIPNRPPCSPPLSSSSLPSPLPPSQPPLSLCFSFTLLSPLTLSIIFLSPFFSFLIYLFSSSFPFFLTLSVFSFFYLSSFLFSSSYLYQ